MQEIPYYGFGLGLRAKHYNDILDGWPDEIDWFEIISENYMASFGRPRHILTQVAEHYPIMTHGVALGIAGADPLDRKYLAELKEFVDWLNPAWMSDHLCWVGVDGFYSHDLLPISYNSKYLSYIADRIKYVQDYFGRNILLENPSSYIAYHSSDMGEAEFMAALADEADCGLLLDINNIYVSCYNHGWDSGEYLRSLDIARIGQLHLAGHEQNDGYIIDTHDDYVIDAVWDLYREFLSYADTPISTMVEWDGKIPDFITLHNEISKAKQIAIDILGADRVKANWRQKYGNIEDIPAGLTIDSKRITYNAQRNEDLYQEQFALQKMIIDGDDALEAIENNKPAWLKTLQQNAPEKLIGIYVNGYRYRLIDVIAEEYPSFERYVGKDVMRLLILYYLQAKPSDNYNINQYIIGFADYVTSVHNNFGDVAIDDFACEIIFVEQKISHIFDVDAGEALAQDDLATIDPERFYDIIFKLRAHSELLELNYPAHEYINETSDANIQDDNESGDNKLKNTSIALQKQYMIIYQSDYQIWRTLLDKKEFLFLQQISAGKNIADALENIFLTNENAKEELDENIIISQLQNWLVKWLQCGILSSNLSHQPS